MRRTGGRWSGADEVDSLEQGVHASSRGAAEHGGRRNVFAAKALTAITGMLVLGVCLAAVVHSGDGRDGAPSDTVHVMPGAAMPDDMRTLSDAELSSDGDDVVAEDSADFPGPGDPSGDEDAPLAAESPPKEAGVGLVRAEATGEAGPQEGAASSEAEVKVVSDAGAKAAEAGSTNSQGGEGDGTDAGGDRQSGEMYAGVEELPAKVAAEAQPSGPSSEDGDGGMYAGAEDLATLSPPAASDGFLAKKEATAQEATAQEATAEATAPAEPAAASVAEPAVAAAEPAAQADAVGDAAQADAGSEAVKAIAQVTAASEAGGGGIGAVRTEGAPASQADAAPPSEDLPLQTSATVSDDAARSAPVAAEVSDDAARSAPVTAEVSDDAARSAPVAAEARDAAASADNVVDASTESKAHATMSAEASQKADETVSAGVTPEKGDSSVTVEDDGPGPEASAEAPPDGAAASGEDQAAEAPVEAGDGSGATPQVVAAAEEAVQAVESAGEAAAGAVASSAGELASEVAAATGLAEATDDQATAAGAEEDVGEVHGERHGKGR